MHTFVLRPLPLPKPDQLVFIHPAATKTGASMPSTWPDFQEWRQAGAPAFRSIAALQIDSFNLALGTRAHTVRGSRVNPDFFHVMGLAPELGRTLTEEDDQPGATPAVILSHRFWEAELGGDSNVIGRKLVIDGAPHTIAGVMPEALTFPGDFCDFWVPLQATPARYKRGDHVLAVVARLRDAGLLDEARSRLSAANQRLQSTFPEYNKDLPSSSRLCTNK